MRIPLCPASRREHQSYPVTVFSGTLTSGRARTSLNHPNDAAERASERLAHFFITHSAPAHATSLARSLKESPCCSVSSLS